MTKLFHFHRIFKKGGEPPEPPLDPPRCCSYTPKQVLTPLLDWYRRWSALYQPTSWNGMGELLLISSRIVKLHSLF